jgi:signal transduction histidine kinase
MALSKFQFPGKILSHIFNMGVDWVRNSDGDIDARRAKRIVLTNQISLSVALLNLPYVLIYPFMGKGLLGWMEVALFFGYAAIHRLNGLGYTTFSRMFFFVLANCDILTYTITLGRGTGMHFLLLLAGWVPLLIFDADRKKSILFGIVLSSSLFIGCEAFVPLHGIDPLSIKSERCLYLLTLLTTISVQGFFAFLYLRANRKTELILTASHEVAREASRTKSTFLAGMNEEILKPLDQILSSTGTLSSSGLAQQDLGILMDIQASALDLSEIVNEMMDLAQIESGKLKLEQAPFNLIDLVHSVLRPFQYEAKKRFLEIHVKIHDQVPKIVLGDATRLKQILRNLLSNGLKFTEKGTVTLEIRLRIDKRLDFEVSDTGIGIPYSAKSRIFEPFFQADTSMSRKFGGTGLGLFISKQLVELMGGYLGFLTRPEGGTTVYFSATLPAYP